MVSSKETHFKTTCKFSFLISSLEDFYTDYLSDSLLSSKGKKA